MVSNNVVDPRNKKMSTSVEKEMWTFFKRTKFYIDFKQKDSFQIQVKR